jgi:hypothetical protein
MPRVGRLSEEEIRNRKIEGSAAYWASEGPRRDALRQATIDQAAGEIGTLTDRELLIAGAVAYWCEGAKSKVYRRNDKVTFVNSDPGLIRLFLRFAGLAGATSDQLICYLHIHESGDIARALQFWREVTGLGAERFARPTIKRHNPKTTRKNTGADYHGCLSIRIRRSPVLYRKFEGWARGVMASAAPYSLPDLLPREDLNLNCRDQNPKSCQLDDAGSPVHASA